MLSKTSANVKNYDGQTKWMYFLIEDDSLLEKYNNIGINSLLIYIYKKKLQIFMIKKFLRWTLITLV